MQPVYPYLNQFVLRHVSAAKSLFVEEQSVSQCLCCPCSLIEFFNKMKKWQDMANLAQDFRQSTDKLERNFTVSAVIFKKYVPIFRSIFKAPSEEPPRVHRSRKQRWDVTPCDLNVVVLVCFGPFQRHEPWKYLLTAYWIKCPDDDVCCVLDDHSINQVSRQKIID